MFLSAIGDLAKAVGGGLLDQGQNLLSGISEVASDPVGSVNEKVLGTRLAGALQDPSKFLEDEIARLTEKIKNGEPLTPLEMQRIRSFQQSAMDQARSSEQFVQLPTGGFVNRNQSRLI